MTNICPCCGAASNFLKDLPRDTITKSMQRLTLDDSINKCTFGDYRLLSCPNCALQFADPMLEPGSDFYAWLAQSACRYPESRWEWIECLQQLKTLQLQPGGYGLNLLDVGCGTGHFLRLSRDVPNCKSVGLDINLFSVQACREAGFEAIHGVLSDSVLEFSKKFNVITFWHVIEHTHDPVGILLMAKTLLAKHGRIYFSVPLSPMSYEGSWPDPLNYPPHHLTRWQLSSIQALAKRVGMVQHITLPSADGLLYRVCRSLYLQAVSPDFEISRIKKLVRMVSFVFLHPSTLFVEIYRQLLRPRMNGKVLPDVVLVCLTNDDKANG